MTAEILIYGEDPGAVNYLAPLPDALETAGFNPSFRLAPSVSAYARDRQISHTVYDGENPASLVASAQPGLLIIGTSENPDSPGLALLDAARNAHTPTLGVIDMAVNAHRRFRGRSGMSLTHTPDQLAVPDTATALAYEDLGMDPAIIHVVGHPHYDVIRKRQQDLQGEDRAALRARLLPDAPADRPVWVFIGEGVDQLDPSESHRSEAYTLSGHGGSSFRTSIVLEELFDAVEHLNPAPWIVLRLHPKMTPADFAPFRDRAGAISDGGDPLPLVWAADAIIGMTSMLMLEAHLLGRPTLSILPRACEAEWLATTANAITPVVTSRPEVQRAVERLCQHPNEFRAKPDSEGAALPHHATEKLVRLCDRILTGSAAT